MATVFDLLMAQFGVGRGLAGDYPTSYDDEDAPYTPAWQEQHHGHRPRDGDTALRASSPRNAEATKGKSMVIIGAGAQPLVQQQPLLPGADHRADPVRLLRRQRRRHEPLRRPGEADAHRPLDDAGLRPRLGQAAAAAAVADLALLHIAISGATRASSPSTRLTAPKARSGPRATPWTSRRSRCGWAGCRSTRSSTATRSTSARRPSAPARRRRGDRRAGSVDRSRTRSSSSPSTIPTPRRTGRASGSSGAATRSRPAPRGTSSSCATTSARTTTSSPRSAPKGKVEDRHVSRAGAAREDGPGRRHQLPHGHVGAVLRHRPADGDLVREERPQHDRPALVRASAGGGGAAGVGVEDATGRSSRLLAKKVSELAPLAFPKPVRDVVMSPLQHDTPDELAQPQVLDWARGRMRAGAGQDDAAPARSSSGTTRTSTTSSSRSARRPRGRPLGRTACTSRSRSSTTRCSRTRSADARPAAHALRRVGRRAVSERSRTRWTRRTRPRRSRRRRTARSPTRPSRRRRSKIGLAAHRPRRGQPQRADDVRRPTQPAEAHADQPVLDGHRQRRPRLRGVVLNVERLVPWRTLTGRQHSTSTTRYYIDFGEHMPDLQAEARPAQDRRHREKAESTDSLWSSTTSPRTASGTSTRPTATTHRMLTLSRGHGARAGSTTRTPSGSASRTTTGSRSTTTTASWSPAPPLAAACSRAPA